MDLVEFFDDGAGVVADLDHCVVLFYDDGCLVDSVEVD